MNLSSTVSGLLAAQKGLTVTGHNLANVNTPGYTRQQLLQHDTGYQNIRENGGYMQQVGMGVSETEIRQIRDAFTDQRFRKENSILSFYQTQNSTINEVETILDEPNGESLSKFLDSFWSQTQKLSTNPSGLEERMSFIQSANVMMEKINYIQDSLVSYQDNLNLQIVNMVNDINELVEEIDGLNDIIVEKELHGQNANDYRDKRNNALDELSSYIDINYSEDPNGTVNVTINGSNGTALLEEGFITKIGLEQTQPKSPYVNPIISSTGDDLFSFTSDTGTIKPAVNSINGNDGGALKALLISRGQIPADVQTSWDDIAINDNYSVDMDGNSFLIPELQKKLDMLTSEIVKMVNESFDGEGIGVSTGLMGPPVFIPIYGGPTLPQMSVIADDPQNPTQAEIDEYNSEMTQYYQDIIPYLTSQNIQVNPALLETGGYNHLGTVTETGNIGDNQKVQELLNKWSEPMTWYDDGSNTAPKEKFVNITDFYADIVTELGQDGYIYSGKASEKAVLVESITNERFSMSAVSQDEELSTLMKYQYAYNASARMLTMLDGMLDVVINKM